MAAQPLLPTATPRTAALTCVIGAHLGVLLLLFFSSGVTPTAPAQKREPALLWIFIPTEPQEGVRSSVPQRPGRTLHVRRPTHPRVSPLADQASAAPGADPGRIDWAREARSTAISEIAREETDRRRAGALTSPQGTLFGNHPRHGKFGWSHAATQRVQSLQSGGLAIHLSDECALIFAGLMLIPVCALEKSPARTDLFEHMHDPYEFAEPAHESRASH